MGSSESTQSSSNGESGTSKKTVASVAAAAVAGVVLVGSGLAMLASSSGSEEQKGNEKLMVAPGSGGASHIPRKDFENDPATYFRNHHLKSGR
ncbi:hypothetical protein LOK49_LG01G00176 [Camellia lanceoleosa]|uniref:Uncharacterized protein n=1 Tax=Camellia lanceoleosa TaxID=1840588 RepID=A0ACC0IXR3_9ERIC|nr:hypothetical protein LOK49_LG01G00176 [Camellia lanceoleosa]